MKEQSEQNYTINCPICGKETLSAKEVYYEVPRFGTMVIISMLCSNCGYRMFDAFSLDFKGPSRVEYAVKNREGLNARVIRSTTATLAIPELGLEIKPGERSEAFITNVEGVLERFAQIAEQLANSMEGDEKTRAHEALAQIKLAMEGKKEFTVVIEDEDGNSAVFGPEEPSPPSNG